MGRANGDGEIEGGRGGCEDSRFGVAIATEASKVPNRSQISEADKSVG